MGPRVIVAVNAAAVRSLRCLLARVCHHLDAPVHTNVECTSDDTGS
jgi:hypothetical protein